MIFNSRRGDTSLGLCREQNSERIRLPNSTDEACLESVTLCSETSDSSGRHVCCLTMRDTVREIYDNEAVAASRQMKETGTQ